MQINKVLPGIAVRDLETARPWYEACFGRPPDAEPMSGLAEWHTPGGVLQLVVDAQRAGGSLATVWVEDVRGALADLVARGGPDVAVDDTTSDKVLFAALTDEDGNAITVVEPRAGAQ